MLRLNFGIIHIIYEHTNFTAVISEIQQKLFIDQNIYTFLHFKRRLYTS